MAKEFVVGHGDLHTMLCNEKILDPLIEGFNMVSRFSGYVGRALLRGLEQKRRAGSHLLSFVVGVVHFSEVFFVSNPKRRVVVGS